MGGARGRRVAKEVKEQVLDLISDANRDGCRLKVACFDLEINFKTYLRWKVDLDDKRKGPISVPKNKLTEEEKNKMIEVATSEDYMDASPHIIVAKLADKGVYIASESSFYKVLRERKLLVHRGKSKAPAKERPAPLVATGPNQIWSWDITYMKSNVRGQFYYLYLFMDIFSRKIVGYNVFEEESMENSAGLFEQIAINENINKDELVLHSDNGGPMKGATMLATLDKLGVTSSFSRPRVSDDNPFSESLFKTLKYVPNYPKHFNSLGDAKQWTMKFVDWYNHHHLHSGIKFVTPSDRHQGLDKKILKNRHQVYQNAKVENPERWANKKTRNWDWIENVNLNYVQGRSSVV